MSKAPKSAGQFQVDVETLQMRGPLRGQVLADFHLQIRNWDVALPSIEPLVLDFGLGRFADFGLIESWIANEVAAGYCAKYLFSFPGQQCPAHSHRLKHETFFLLAGHVHMTVDRQSFELTKGDTLALPPGHVHGFQATGATLILEVSTPCLPEDNDFLDTRADQWLRAATGPRRTNGLEAQ